MNNVYIKVLEKGKMNGRRRREGREEEGDN